MSRTSADHHDARIIGTEIDDEVPVGSIRVHADRRSRDVRADAAQVRSPEFSKGFEVGIADITPDGFGIGRFSIVMTRDLHRRPVKCREAVHVSKLRVVEKNREADGRETFHALLDLEPGEHLALDGQRQRTQIPRPWPPADTYPPDFFPPPPATPPNPAC